MWKYKLTNLDPKAALVFEVQYLETNREPSPGPVMLYGVQLATIEHYRLTHDLYEFAEDL